MSKIIECMPHLRFPSYQNKGIWHKYKLGDIAQLLKGKGISKDEVSPVGATPCVRYGELYTHYKEVIDEVRSYTNLPAENLFMSQANDVIIPSSGETKEDIATASCVLHGGIALGGDINVIRTSNSGVFLAYYLNNVKKNDISKVAQGISIIHLYNEQLRNLSINLPSLPEQQKIANCLSTIDDYVSNINRNIIQLQLHKQGLIQKIFPQRGKSVPEFRFSEFRDFKGWEENRLGEIFNRVMDKNKKMSHNVLTISAQYGLISQYDYFNKNVAALDIDNYYLIKKDDFAYNKSRSQGYPYGAIKPLRLYEEGVISTLYICFRAKGCECNIDFFEQYFESGRINDEIGKIAQEGARNHGLLNISTDDFFNKISVMVPSPSEQSKISECLSSLDNLIKYYKDKKDLLILHKKGLMQQLFPQ